MHRLFILTVACALLSACSSEPMKTSVEVPVQVAKPADQIKPMPVAAPTVETYEQKMARAIKALAADSVYFDYDNYSIKPKYQEILKHDYELLMASPKLLITLVGNADERGSTEYNLALGQKRAESVKRALTMLGVPETQLEAISYGKEKPRAVCHEEQCWAENRRVDFAAKTAGVGR